MPDWSEVGGKTPLLRVFDITKHAGEPLEAQLQELALCHNQLVRYAAELTPGNSDLLGAIGISTVG